MQVAFHEAIAKFPTYYPLNRHHTRYAAAEMGRQRANNCTPSSIAMPAAPSEHSPLKLLYLSLYADL